MVCGEFLTDAVVEAAGMLVAVHCTCKENNCQPLGGHLCSGIVNIYIYNTHQPFWNMFWNV